MVLSEHERPQLWFCKTINERSKSSSGAPRLRLLDTHDQYVPTDTEGFYSSGNTEVNIQADKAVRADNPIGTIFAIKGIKTRFGGASNTGAMFYSAVPEDELYILTGPNAISSSDKVMRPILDAYQDWIATGKTPSGVFKREPVKKEVTIPKKDSVLDKIVSAYPCPTPKTNGFYVDPLQWRQLAFNLIQGHNTLLLGASGSGKTELTGIAAAMMGYTRHVFDMGSKTDGVAAFMGTHRHRADKGGSYFDRSAFTYAIQEKGMVLLDELSRDRSFAYNMLFPVLDSRREFFLDIAPQEEERLIKVNPECRFVATANVGLEFVGTTEIDPALKQRFQIIKLSYPPAKEESTLINLRTKALKKSCDTIVAAAGAFRELAREGELSEMVSMRHTLYAGELVSGGFDVDEALNMSILPYMKDEEEEKARDILNRF